MNTKALTLVELIVSITIAMLLMASIGVFVSSGMNQLFLQQKSVFLMNDINDFSLKLNESFDTMSSGALIGSGIVMKTNKHFDNGTFSYIGTSQEDKLFCEDNESESTRTNHIFIKNFIPYFEKGETDLEQTLTAQAGGYTSYQKEHKITDSSGNIIAGTGFFGRGKANGTKATQVELNSPTGLVSIENKLYISDTLNNRVLYLSGANLYTLLDEDDGLKEPTGLYYNDNEKALYIANSGKGEILRFSSREHDTNSIIPFSVDITGQEINNLSHFYINFSNELGPLQFKLPEVNTQANIGVNVQTNIFEGKENYSRKIGKNISYYFSDYKQSGNIMNEYFSKKEDENEGDKNTQIKKYITDICNSEKKDINYYIYRNIPRKLVVNCTTSTATGETFTGTINVYHSSTYPNIHKNEHYNINLENLTISGSVNGNIYATTTFYQINNPDKPIDTNFSNVYQKKQFIFTSGDGKIFTPSDNILEIYKKGLSYPNGIWGNGENDFHNFDPSTFTNYQVNTKYDILLDTPIKNLDINLLGNNLTFVLKYYRNYNCYNLDENSKKIKTFLYKKNL